MNKLMIGAVTTSLLLGTGTLYASSLDLEPCMNGDVSASGMFPTQVAEDQHHFYAMAEQEPCMNGDVPPDGVLATPTETGARFSSTQ